MSLASMIAGFYLFIFHFLFAMSFTDGRYADGSGVSSTYNHSRKQEMRNTGESRSLFQINDDIFVVNQNTSKSNINSPNFVEKPLERWTYLANGAGYYKVQSSGARMFYVFIRSQAQVVNAPVVLWLNGGPGYSGNIGLFYENGPYKLGNDLSFVRNLAAWYKMSNVIYVDQPIGTGLSYANNDDDIRSTLDDITNDLYTFLQEFFGDLQHEEYTSNKFFIAGESYAGHYAPALARKIKEENMARRGISINLIGVAIGNALLDLGIQYATIPNFALRFGLITQEDKNVLENLVETCKASVRGCGRGNEMSCHKAFPDCNAVLRETVNASGKHFMNIDEDHDSSKYDFSKVEEVLNQDDLKSRLGVPQDKNFTFHNMEVFNALRADWAKSSQQAVSKILQLNVKVLIYVGVLDLQYNFDGIEDCAQILQWGGKEAFNNAEPIPVTVHTKVEGYRFTYQHLTYIRVLNAGQMVLIDQPKTAFVMMHNWMQGEF